MDADEGGRSISCLVSSLVCSSICFLGYLYTDMSQRKQYLKVRGTSLYWPRMYSWRHFAILRDTSYHTIVRRMTMMVWILPYDFAFRLTPFAFCRRRRAPCRLSPLSVPLGMCSYPTSSPSSSRCTGDDLANSNIHVHVTKFPNLSRRLEFKYFLLSIGKPPTSHNFN